MSAPTLISVTIAEGDKALLSRLATGPTVDTVGSVSEAVAAAGPAWRVNRDLALMAIAVRGQRGAGATEMTTPRRARYRSPDGIAFCLSSVRNSRNDNVRADRAYACVAQGNMPVYNH